MKKKNKSYTVEFKLESVDLAQNNGVAKTARDLEINESMLRRWVKEFKNGKFDETKISSDKSHEQLLQENAKLKKENLYLKEINKVLKKSTAIFSKDQIPNID